MLSVGCSDSADRASPVPAPAPSGARLVVGSSLEEWNLLLIPTDGGQASLRDLADPGIVLWESAVQLPRVRTTVTTHGGLTALQQADGTVYRFEPRSDELTRVGAVKPGGGWTVAGDHLLYSNAADSSLFQMSREGNWRYKIGQRVEWASVVEDGGIAVLVGAGSRHELWFLRRGESAPAAKAEFPLFPPGVVTAWGRRVALMSGEDPPSVLQFIAVPELTVAGSEELDERAVAMEASASSHEVYVALADGRLLAVNRLTGVVRTLARFEAPVAAIRPVVLGGYLIVQSGGAAHRVDLDGGSRPLEGEWTADLPLGLPDGRVLVAREATVRIRTADGGSENPVGGTPAEGGWSMVRWNPAPPVVAGRVDGVPLPDSTEEDGEVTAAWTPSEEAAGGARGGGPEPPPNAMTPSERLLGFYTIVASARAYPGVLSLTQSLNAAGYPTAIQTHQDDAGVTWYRGLVGPYASRESAEAAARQLRRERGFQVWVTEIGTGLPSEEPVN